MSRAGFPVLLVLSALWLAGHTGAVQAADSDTRTFAVFDSAGMNRAIRGQKRDLDLSARGLGVGEASAFFGVDALSNADSHYLTSGIQWQSGQRDQASLFRVEAMHTAARGSQIGSQTLMRAESQLQLGQRWYLPAVSLETEQLTGAGDAAATGPGRATHLGLSRGDTRRGYQVAYFRASSGFDAWGSGLAAGDRGIELSAHYGLADRWQLKNTVRVHDAAIETGTRHGVVDAWHIAQAQPANAIGRPWRLSGQIGAAGVARDQRAAPLALRLGGPTRQWGAWQLDSAVGWYAGLAATPDDLPIDGGLWQVSFDRAIDLGGLRARLQPRLAIGGSQDDAPYGGRAGLGVVLPGMLDHVALNMDYAAAGWSRRAGRGDMRMMLNFTQNAGAVLAPLQPALDRLR